MNRLGNRRKQQQNEPTLVKSSSTTSNVESECSKGTGSIIRWAQRRLSSHATGAASTTTTTPVNVSSTPARSVFSLGSGSLSPDGFVENWSNAKIDYRFNVFVGSGNRSKRTTTVVSPFAKDDAESDGVITRSLSKPFLRYSSSFLRVSDLAIEETQSITDSIVSSLSSPSNVDDKDTQISCDTSYKNNDDHPRDLPDNLTTYANFHYVSSDPPPGHTAESKERWVALDNGAGKKSPIAVAAVKALEQFCREDICLNADMWTPADRSTEKINTKPHHSWQKHTFDPVGCCPSLANTDPTDKDTILMWSGKVLHGFYGNDVPLVRAASILDISPKELLELLLDSSRVTEYNEMSLGRDDLLVLQGAMNDDTEGTSFGGVTKIVRSQSRPPMLRKTLQSTSLMHARELADGSGYILLTRGVTVASDDAATDTSAAGIVIAEILNGINIIKHVEGNPNQCMFIAVHHVRSPILPLMLTRRIGLQAVVNFVQDLRKCCNKNCTTL